MSATRERRIARAAPQRPFVICVRFTKDELDALNRLVSVSRRQASDIMRDAIGRHVRSELHRWEA